ncbi:MAG: AMP-binding protein [Ectothiorhodospiraceae bacterium]|nr:AMP-binding protein [Ectothiorhodospiraceae bacterium]
MRVIDFFDRGALLNPDGLCLTDEAASYTYREAQAFSHRVARMLMQRGIRPDERVAVLSPNDARGYAAYLGIIRAEAALVPLNARNTVEDNLHHLRIGTPRILFYHSDFSRDVQAYLDATPSLEGAICIDTDDGHHPSLNTLLAGVDDSPVPPPERFRDRDGLFRISCTGGTTGTPKGVMHTNLSYELNTAAFLALWRFDEPPRMLLVAPMTHAGGGLAPPIFAMGGTIRMLKKADPVRIMEVIQNERIHTTMLPPTVIYMLLDHPEVRKFDYSSMRYLCFSAAPMAEEKIRRAIEVFGPCITQFYAQTEVVMTMTYMSPEEYAEAARDPSKAHRLGSAGRPGPFSVLGIMDEDGRLLPDGEVGEIVVRSNQVMAGYWDNPDATAQASAHGWHHTGDLGYRDADGYYYLVDRKRDLIISGGFNVFSNEVERVLLAHPAVQECAVIGLPDEKWGEAVTAFVQLAPGHTATEEELRDWCRPTLGGVKTPKRIEFREELPRSPVGKVLKRVIRDQYWKDRNRAI